MRKGWVATIGGAMIAIGQIPLGVQYAHLPFTLPLWWNSCQFPLWLVGTLGGIVVGTVAKGMDDHSTVDQVAVATAEQTPLHPGAQMASNLSVKSAGGSAQVSATQSGPVDPQK